MSLEVSPYRKMLTRRELSIIINTAGKYISGKFVDIIQVLHLLKKRGFVDNNTFQELKTEFEQLTGTQKEKTVWLITKILYIMRFDDIVQFLKVIGLKEFALDILRQCYGECIAVRIQTTAGVSLKTLEFYNNLKRNMDNCVFKNRREDLTRMANVLRQKMINEQNLGRKQHLVNRLAVVTYQLVALYRSSDERERLLNQMLESAPRDVNLTLTNVVYNSKMAVTAIHRRDVVNAERYMARAHELCSCNFDEGSTWIKALEMHDRQYHSRCLASIEPSHKHVKNTYADGQTGIDAISTYSKDKADVFVKVFKTEIVMGLLSITNDFAVDTEHTVEKDNLRQAEEVLNSFLSNQPELEIRREMMVYLCKARIHEDDDLETAKSYADEALKLAPEGTHFDHQLQNIENYRDYLDNRTMRKSVAD